jgi:1-acyl-sn-glycerol-3-phosphate acyltransferase
MKRPLSTVALLAFHAGFVRPVLRWVIGVRFRRAGLVPRGPCIVVSNHNSHLDAAVLMSLFPLRRLRDVHPVAAADYFGSSWLRRTMAMALMNGIPIERRARPGCDPLAPLVEAVEAGKALIFFPEGSRGEAGVVSPFRPGIGKLVQRIPGLLVAPVFLSGPERIWARGEVVPIPGAIDVIVGRPRVYRPDRDARDIAEEVQRDVVQLAPPEPPRPGAEPPPVRIAVCGVDAQARGDVFRRLTSALGRTHRTLGIADPVIEAEDGREREITGPIPETRIRSWVGTLARVFRTGERYEGDRFGEMVDRAQVEEVLGKRPSARFVVTDGSPLVDLLAWADADFYRGVLDDAGIHHLLQFLSGERQIPFSRWWSYIRSAPEVWLLNTFELAQPPVPHVLVFVDLPVQRVLERLRRRGEAQRSYENEAFLVRLVAGYRNVARVLARRRKVACFDVDREAPDADQALVAVEAACRKLAQGEVGEAPGAREAVSETEDV